MNNPTTSSILVDAHVHIYDCFELDALLTVASRNFCNAAEQLDIKSNFTCVLLLTETSRDNWFQQTKTTDTQPVASGQNNWHINQTLDDTVLIAKQQNSDTNPIYIMAGRQIITAEGLELLALVTNHSFEDGLPIATALDKVNKSDAIAVLPWAVGKWLGKRGKLLSKLLDAEKNSGLCIGDNSGRPTFWRNPLHFRQAKTNNISLLPGTDPLPLPKEANRIGSFGFMMKGSLSEETPSADLKQLIKNGDLKISTYGRLESPIRFFINQIRLRLS